MLNIKTVVEKPTFESLKPQLVDLILKSMELDHLDWGHKKSEEPNIVVGHIERTAQAVVFGQHEIILEAEKKADRDHFKRKMKETYLRGEAIDRIYHLSGEFKSEERLDAAVQVAHNFLATQDARQPTDGIVYKALSWRVIGGQ